jgi:hypothetical protein
MRLAVPFAAILPAFAACGPVSVEQAERDCVERARAATHPTGFVEAGFGRHDAQGAIEIDINSDYLSGKDPAALYNACVARKTGQPPRQPLHARSDWRR